MEKKELGREDVIEALKKIAFGRVNRGVELTYLSEPTAELIRKMDLSAVAEFKRNANGTVEVKFVDRVKALSALYDMLGGGDADEAAEFFSALPKLRKRLQTLQDVGLGYVKLGQPSTELSGGEAQRVKLATELSRRATGRTFYILDEPTTGLHSDDVKKLLEVLQRLVDAGNTVLVIEHNLDLIKCADHIIDLGPEGGSAGGEIVAEGTPEQVAEVPGSFTGQYLKPLLEKDKLLQEKEQNK